MRTELQSWRRAWPRIGKATVDVEVEAEVVEEEEDAEEEKEEEGGGEEQGAGASKRPCVFAHGSISLQ